MSKTLSTSLMILLGLVVLAIIAISIANLFFQQMAQKEIKALMAVKPRVPQTVITKADLAQLPLCVQRWQERSGIVGKPRIETVRLKQTGLMRLAEDKPWMPVEAEQYFNVTEPGFIWIAKVKMAPLVYLSGRDKYTDGHGNMLIKLYSLIPLVSSTGKELDQGTLLRYLAEMQWFPSAALNDYISWEAIDENKARATMSYKGVTASGVFTFSEQGDLISFIAKRYREDQGKYVLEDWGGIAKEFKEFQGVRIGSKLDVIWHYQTGDFNWYQCEITELEFNTPQLY